MNKLKGKRYQIWVEASNIPLVEELVKHRRFSQFINEALNKEMQFEVEMLELKKQQIQQNKLRFDQELNSIENQIKIASEREEKRLANLRALNKKLPVRPF